MEAVHGPHFVNSWVLAYREPMDQVSIDFLRADVRSRLDACAENGTIPKLADVRISRLIAENARLAARVVELEDLVVDAASKMIENRESGIGWAASRIIDQAHKITSS